MCNNNIFFRVDDDLFKKLNKIKNTYKFKSNAELSRTIITIFCELYANKKRTETTQEVISNIFNEYENGELVFDYTKPKKQKPRKKRINIK